MTLLSLLLFAVVTALAAGYLGAAAEAGTRVLQTIPAVRRAIEAVFMFSLADFLTDRLLRLSAALQQIAWYLLIAFIVSVSVLAVLLGRSASVVHSLVTHLPYLLLLVAALILLRRMTGRR